MRKEKKDVFKLEKQESEQKINQYQNKTMEKHNLNQIKNLGLPCNSFRSRADSS